MEFSPHYVLRIYNYDENVDLVVLRLGFLSWVFKMVLGVRPLIPSCLSDSQTSKCRTSSVMWITLLNALAFPSNHALIIGKCWNKWVAVPREPWGREQGNTYRRVQLDELSRNLVSVSPTRFGEPNPNPSLTLAILGLALACSQCRRAMGAPPLESGWKTN